MTEFNKSENHYSEYLNLLDILREKTKIRLGNFQPGESIVLEHSVENTNLQLERYKISTSETNLNPSFELLIASNSTDTAVSEPNTNSLPFANHIEYITNSSNQNEDQADFSSKQLSKKLKVFISYSIDSIQHKKRVIKLCNILRKQGIDCDIDEFIDILDKGWYDWMKQQIEEADFIIVVCTENYKTKFEKRKGGVGREGRIIDQELYDDTPPAKFIPLTLLSRPPPAKFIPLTLLSRQENIDRQETEKDIQAVYKKYVPSSLRRGYIFNIYKDNIDEISIELYSELLDNNSKYYDEGYENFYRYITKQRKYKKENVGNIIQLNTDN